MHAASDALKAWLPTARQPYRANLYTFTLVNGTVYRWTDADRDIVSGGDTFISTGPQISRDTVEFSASNAPQTTSLTLTIADGDTASGVGTLTILQAIAQGAFDRAQVKVEAAFMATFGDTAAMGTIILFSGRLATMSQINRASAQLEVRSYVELFDTQFPRNLYQASCPYTLYDAGCTLSRASFTVTGTVGTGSSSTIILPSSALGHTDAYFALGVLTFTSGANNGLSYVVKSYTAASNGTITFERPALLPVAVGDTFTIAAGCDKTLTTCTDRFGNAANFGGQPFIPSAETAV